MESGQKPRSTRAVHTRSRRSFEEACIIAGLPTPNSAAAVTETYLRLLVQGVDHARVGDELWLEAILADAPREGRLHAE